MHEKITAGASACAVIVSIFSTVVSCSSQKEVESVKQAYATCNTKTQILSGVVSNRFSKIDDSAKEISLLTFNPAGVPIVPTDVEKQRAIVGHLSDIGGTIDKIWREASPFLTGDREIKLKALYDGKVMAANNVTAMNNAGKVDLAVNNTLIVAINAFLSGAAPIINDEIHATITSTSCGGV